MPQYVETENGEIEFPDNMSRDEIIAAMKKISSQQQPAQQQQKAKQPLSPLAPTISEEDTFGFKAAAARKQTEQALTKPAQPQRGSMLPPVEGSGGAAFGVFRRPTTKPAPAQEAKKPEAAEKPTLNLSVAEVANDPELFKRAEAYLTSIGGDKYKEGESKEDYVNRFADATTTRDWSASLSAVQLSRLVGGDKKLKQNIAEGLDLAKNMADRPGWRPYAAAAKGIASDIPLTLISGGVGKVAGQATLKLATKEAAKKLITDKALSTAARVGIAGSEAAVGAASEIQTQRIEQERAKLMEEKPKDIEWDKVAVATVFSGALGAIGGRVADPAKAAKQGEELSKAFKSKNIVPATPTSPQTPAEKVVVDAVTEQMDRVYAEYVQQTGRELIDAIDPANELTDAKVKTEFSKTAVRMAMKVMEADPNFAMKPNEQVSTAIMNVFKNLDKIDDVTLERAMADAGVNAREFAMMNKVTVSDAARVMQQYSVASRFFKDLAKRDKDFESKIAGLYEYDDVATSAFGKLMQGQEKLAREWKVWITSGVDTTARNVLSTALVLPMKSGVQFMEGTAFAIGNAMSDAAKGNRVKTLYRSMGDTVKDSFDVYFYLAKNGLAKDVTESLLKDAPSLRHQIVDSLQETGEKEISAVGKWASSFNVAVDSFQRRAIFTASVEQQLRRQGKDLYKDFLATNTAVPTDILKQATKESLQATFAYLPKRGGDPLVASTVERMAGETASAVISAIDKTPFVNFAIPFPRYMANAMGYLYRYSPAGSIGAGEEFLKARKLAQAGNVDKAMMLHRQASEKMVQAAIGTAALAAAYEYRVNNPDVPWYEAKTNEGTTVDVRPLGVPATYFAIADVFARHEQGTLKTGDVKAAIESATGLKVKAGSQDTFIDRLFRAFDSETEFKGLMVEMGKSIGDIAGGFTQPFVVKQMVDMFNLIRDEGRVARDPNVIEGEGVMAGAEAAVKRVMNRLPVLKEQLPEAVARLNEEELSREGEYFNRLLGFRQTIQRSPEETEIVRLNLNPYSLYGTSSGDKQYDRSVIEAANAEVLPMVKALMNNEQYQSLPDVEKAIAMTELVREQVGEAKKLVNKEYSANDLQRIYKMKYDKLPALTKRAIDKRYKEDNNGVSIEQSKDYFAIDAYEAELKARTGFATGGLVSQTERMLSTAR